MDSNVFFSEKRGSHGDVFAIDFSGEVMDLEPGDSPGDWMASAKVRRTVRTVRFFGDDWRGGNISFFWGGSGRCVLEALDEFCF